MHVHHAREIYKGGGGGNNAEKMGATNKAIEIRTQCPRNRASLCYIEKLHRSDSPTGFKHFSRVVLSLALSSPHSTRWFRERGWKAGINC